MLDTKNADKVKIAIYSIALLLLCYSILPCLGVTYDSILYIESARSLGNVGFYHEAFKAKPPLFIIILYLFQENQITIFLLNIICWATSVYLLEKILTRQYDSHNHILYQTVWIAFSTPLFLVHNFVWTEPLFLVFILVFFQLLTSQHRSKFFILPVLSLAIISLRHLGVLFIIGGLFSQIYSKRFQRNDLVWLLSGVIFFVGWQFFVYQLRGDLERLNHFSGLDILSNYLQLGKTITHWFFPFNINAINWITPLLLLALVTLSIKYFDDPIIRSIALATLLNILMILLKGELIPADVERYLFFVHPFLLLLVIKAVEQAKFPRFVHALIILLITYTIIRTIKNSLMWHNLTC